VIQLHPVRRRSEKTVTDTLVRWAEERPDVQAVLLTSSRTDPDARLDDFSDYDVILVVRDIREFLDDGWLEDFGSVLVVYRDPITLDHGCERFARVTQYEDGAKIDFTLWPLDLLRQIAAEPKLPDYLDDGYRVLIDKTGITAGLKAPSHSAYVPGRPTEEEYRNCVGEFFSESCYVAKQICRGDLFSLKYSLDHVMKFKKLRQMLEWLIETENNWSLKTGSYGKGIRRHVAPELWAKFEDTYAGAGDRENWEALFKTIALFREVATRVVIRLGYSYPQKLDDRVVKYLLMVQELHG
jgi:aminoglycoside 6-adenylyltransferase